MNRRDLNRRIAKANEDAMARFDEAAAETDAKRSDELLAEGEQHAAEAQRLLKIEQAREATAARQDADAARRLSGTPERAFADDAEKARTEAEQRATRWAMPTEAELEARSRAATRILERGLHGVDEETARTAKREWPVEDLFFDALRSRFAMLKGGTPTLVGEKRQAWEDYVARATAVQQRLDSPLAGGQSTTAGEGGEFVPETWSAEIVANMAFYGPMASTAKVRRFTNTHTGEYHVATVTDNETKKAVIVAEKAKTTKEAVDTDDVTLNPRNTAVQIPFTDQMLMGGNINLRGFIERDVPEWFGRAINEWYTTGNGNNVPKGLDAIAKTTENNVEIADGTKIEETDVYGWVGKLDKSYLDMPSTSVMMHWATVLLLMQVRSSQGAGERVFPLTPDRRSVIIPPAGMVEANNAIPAFNAGTGTIGILGDLGMYGCLQLGAMNVEMQRNLESFQWLLSWNFFQDGQPLNEKAFAFLKDK